MDLRASTKEDPIMRRILTPVLFVLAIVAGCTTTPSRRP
jgi:hypothetical protein